MTTRSLAKDWVLAEREGRVPLALRIEAETLRSEGGEAWIRFVFERDRLRGDPGFRSLMHAVQNPAPGISPVYIAPVWMRIVAIAATCSLLWLTWHWLATGERMGR
jgi:hypothetical protein